MSDAPIRLCPSCGEERVERLISTGGGIVFKGSGFYATDYRESEGGGGKTPAKEASGDAASGSTDGASDGASSGSSEGDAGA